MQNVEVCELRFEDYGNNNHRFYRVYLWNTGALTQWGRIGAKGQFKPVSRSAARRMVDEKLGKGYAMTTPWTTFGAMESDLDGAESGSGLAYTQLNSAANLAIGGRVSATPVAAAKSESEQEDDFAQQLLAMRGKYTKPEPQAAPAGPEQPQVDPNSVEGRLGAALAAARSKE